MTGPVVEITLFMLAVYLGSAWTYYKFAMAQRITRAKMAAKSRDFFL